MSTEQIVVVTSYTKTGNGVNVWGVVDDVVIGYWRDFSVETHMEFCVLCWGSDVHTVFETNNEPCPKLAMVDKHVLDCKTNEELLVAIYNLPAFPA